MRIKVNQYDTIRDTKGQRYRITEISESLGACKARKVGIDGQVVSKGRERTIMLEDIDGRKYQRVNLAPVQVTKQEPRPDLLRKPQETKKASVEELFIKDEKAPQIEKDEPSKDEAEKSIEGGRSDMHERINKKIADETQDLEVVRAELKEKLQEGIDLKERLASSIKEREKADRTVAEQRKTISKMHDTIAGLLSAGINWQAAQRRCEELEKENDMLAKNLSELQQQVEKRNADAAAFLTSNELDIAMSYIDGAMTDPHNEKVGMTQAIAALDVILTIAANRAQR